MYKDLPFDPIKDFTPVTLTAYSPQLLAIYPGVAAKTPQEFISLAKSAPGRMSFGSSGTGSSPHLALELFKRAAGIDLVHVPYKGSGLAIIDLIAGQVQAINGGVAGFLPHVGYNRPAALWPQRQAEVALAGCPRSIAVRRAPTWLVQSSAR